MNKSVLYSAALGLPVVYGLVALSAPWWAVAGLVFVLALMLFNTLAYVVIAAYWQVFAKISEPLSGNLKARITELVDQQSGENLAEKQQKTLLGMIQLGTATLTVLNSHMPVPTFILHILLSAAIFFAAYTSGFVMLAYIILFTEIVSYNCIYWLAKHKQKILTEVEQAIRLLEEKKA